MKNAMPVRTGSAPSRLRHWSRLGHLLSDEELAELIIAAAGTMTRPTIGFFLSQLPALPTRPVAFDAALEVCLAYEARRLGDAEVALSSLLHQHPVFATQLRTAHRLALDFPGMDQSPCARRCPPLATPAHIGRPLTSGRPRYTLCSHLGTGSQAVVYLARDHAATGSGSPWVAIKQCDPAVAAIEIRAAQAVKHPNVIRMLDTFAAPIGSFAVMPFASGGTLASIRSDVHRTSETILDMMHQLAAGVHALHVAGIVHRDLKPANVLIDGHRPVLCDLGVASEIDESPFIEDAGSLGFISPQQYAGMLPSPRDDIYALGGILYWLLTGECPNGSCTAEARHQLLTSERHHAFIPRLQRHVPAMLHELILSTLSPDPSQRPKTASAIAAAMRSLKRASFGQTL